MGETERYLQNAEEAEKRAAQAKTEHDRDAYLKIAEGWPALFVQAEATQKRGGV